MADEGYHASKLIFYTGTKNNTAGARTKWQIHGGRDWKRCSYMHFAAVSEAKKERIKERENKRKKTGKE